MCKVNTLNLAVSCFSQSFICSSFSSDRCSVLGFVIKLSVVAILTRTWHIDQLIRLEEHGELFVTILTSKDSSCHIFSREGALALIVIITNRVTNSIGLR